MDYNEHQPERDENTGNTGNTGNVENTQSSAPATPTASPTASTSRRTVTAILVLTAALLLGYVLYDVLLRSSVDTQVPLESRPLVDNQDQGKKSAEERKAILEAMMNDKPQVELSAAELQERRDILEAMNAEAEAESDTEMSDAEKKAILEAMQ